MSLSYWTHAERRSLIIEAELSISSTSHDMVSKRVFGVGATLFVFELEPEFRRWQFRRINLFCIEFVHQWMLF